MADVAAERALGPQRRHADGNECPALRTPPGNIAGQIISTAATNPGRGHGRTSPGKQRHEQRKPKQPERYRDINPAGRSDVDARPPAAAVPTTVPTSVIDQFDTRRRESRRSAFRDPKPMHRPDIHLDARLRRMVDPHHAIPAGNNRDEQYPGISSSTPKSEPAAPTTGRVT